MNKQHTPEPWHLYELSHVIYNRDANGKAHGIARVYGGDKLANARRIVACVNACAGEPTGALELSSYCEQVDLKVKFFDECQRLKAANDELLAALKGLFDSYCSAMHSEYDYPNGPWTPERDDDAAAIAAQEAIAKVEQSK